MMYGIFDGNSLQLWGKSHICYDNAVGTVA